MEQFHTLSVDFNELWSREDNISGRCSHTASSLRDKTLTCFMDGTVNCAYKQ